MGDNGIESNLNRLLKGSLILFIGITVSMFLGFFTNLIVIRFLSLSDFGTFSLALTITGIVLLISALGLEEGISRFIAYHRGKEDDDNVKKVVASSLFIALVSSLIFSVLFYFSIDFIANGIFKIDGLSNVLYIFVIIVAPTIFIKIIVSIIRGQGNYIAQAIFIDIIRPAIFLLFIAALILVNISLFNVVIAYVLSFIIVLLLIVIIFKKELQFDKKVDLSNVKVLLKFSIPLLAVNALLTITNWTSTLFLGLYSSTENIALFNVAFGLANLLYIVINAIGFLFVPHISGLYAKNNIEVIKKDYITTTKWCFICTLPVFFIFVIFPGTLVSLFYGDKYNGAFTILQILAIGFMLNPLSGPNYQTLVSFGRINDIVLAFFISSIINIIANIILIPAYGIYGAAVASSMAVGVANLILSIQLNKIGVNPLNFNYFKTIIISSILIISLYIIIAKLTIYQSLIIAAVSTTIFCIALIILIFITNSIDDRDKNILRTIKNIIIKT